MSFYLCNILNTNYNQTYANVSSTTYPGTSPNDIAYRFPTMYSGSFSYTGVNETISLPISCTNLVTSSSGKYLYIQNINYSCYSINSSGDTQSYANSFYYFNYYSVGTDPNTNPVKTIFTTYPKYFNKLNIYGNPFTPFDDITGTYKTITVYPTSEASNPGDGRVLFSLQTQNNSSIDPTTTVYWSITINV